LDLIDLGEKTDIDSGTDFVLKHQKIVPNSPVLPNKEMGGGVHTRTG
jgi:hypothetical protein